MCLAVYFDGRFWVGVIEESDGGLTRAYRHTFDAEPSDMQILMFVRHGLDRSLWADCPAVPVDAGSRNPKRREREAARALEKKGGSTAAREALSRQYEERAEEARKDRRREREDRDILRWEAARMKAKKRHKGH